MSDHQLTTVLSSLIKRWRESQMCSRSKGRGEKTSVAGEAAEVWLCGWRVGGVRVWMWVWVWVWVCFGWLGGVYQYGFRSKRRCCTVLVLFFIYNRSSLTTLNSLVVVIVL